MTVYVDDMEAPFRPDHVSGRVYVMCHMIADTEAELHAMADRIGIARKWHQGDHYDIAKSKRALAVKAGARQVTWRQAGTMMKRQRRGEPMLTQEEIACLFPIRAPAEGDLTPLEQFQRSIDTP